MTPEEIQAIAEYYNKEASKKKTETIQLRVTPRFKNDIKRAAEAKGYKHYQKWMSSMIYDALAEIFPDEYGDPGDDY